MTVLNLFPVPVYCVNISDTALSKAIDDAGVDKMVEPNTTWNCKVDTGFFNRDLLCNTIKQQAEKDILPFAADFAKSYISSTVKSVDVSIISIWLNRYYENYSQEPHDHIGEGSIAFNYVHKTEYPDTSFSFSDASSRGADRFMKQTFGVGFTQDEFTLELRSGDLILFPVWLTHFVAHKKKFERVTLSGNIQLYGES